MDMQHKEALAQLGTHEFEIICITSSGCGPCVNLKNTGFPALHEHFKNKDIAVYAVEHSKDVPSQVDSVPWMYLYFKGKRVPFKTDEEIDENGCLVGFGDAQGFVQFFEQLFKKIE